MQQTCKYPREWGELKRRIVYLRFHFRTRFLRLSDMSGEEVASSYTLCGARHSVEGADDA